jgi:hypothetical protein
LFLLDTGRDDYSFFGPQSAIFGQASYCTT